MLQNSKIFTGFMALLNDSSTVLMIAAPIIGGLLIGIFFLRRGAADEQDQKKWNSRIFIAIISIVGVELASIIIALVLSYFK